MLMFMMFVGIVILMFIGVPTAISLGATSLAAYAATGQLSNIFTMAQNAYSSVSGTTLLAIPFFMLMGELMNRTGISARLFDFGRAFVGHTHGGLAHATIIACAIMAAMSGSVVACAASIGMISIGEMEKSGYDKNFSCGVVASAATLGPIIPPSIFMIIYASNTGVSVSAMFMAGVVPGVILALLFMVVATVISKKRNYAVSAKMPWKDRWQVVLKSIPALLAPVIIIGGMFSGMFTATEAAAVAALYVLVLGVFYYRSIKLKDLPVLFWGAMVNTTKIMLIMGLSGIFKYILMYLRVPQVVLNAVSEYMNSEFMILLFMLVVWLIMGCFLEGTAILLITQPIFTPILESIGFNFIQYGLLATVASCVGVLTPPLGVNLYTVSSIAQVPVMKIAREVLPFIAVMVLVCILLILFPQMSLFLPNLLNG